MNRLLTGSISPNTDNDYHITFDYPQHGPMSYQKKITISRVLLLSAFDALMDAIDKHTITLRDTTVTVTVSHSDKAGQDVTVEVIGPKTNHQKKIIGRIVTDVVTQAASNFELINQED